MILINRFRFSFLVVLGLLIIQGCANQLPAISDLTPSDTSNTADKEYLIGPDDSLKVFVWRNAELSATVPVRPDGKITTPLVEDVVASGKTSSQLARELEQRLAHYVKSPIVTVTVVKFIGRYSEQIRVVGEAATPRSLPYRENMTLLDVLIAVGGLTEFADGNDAKIVRIIDGKQQQFSVRLYDLLKRGDISANLRMSPGDILIIPESWF